MFEFGILRAIGTRPFQMGLLIVLEAGCLALLSCFIGIAIATGLIAYFSHAGIDYSGTEFVNVAINEPIRAIFRPAQFIVYPLVTILFTMMAGIYPALHAARMTPMRAIRNQI
jgi:ABC-type antimicrobial peptide transport system permease subunit